jgi:hypothetical protein
MAAALRRCLDQVDLHLGLAVEQRCSALFKLGLRDGLATEITDTIIGASV